MQSRKIANLTRAEFAQASRWSCEEFYYFLKSRCQTRTEFYGVLAEFDGRDSLAGDLRPKTCGACETCETCKPSDQQAAKTEANEEKRNWQQRLSLLRGRVPELLDRLAKELPRVQTPWEQIFRSIVQTAFQEATHKNYSRPDRRWLALERGYKTQAGVNPPFAPDTVKKRGTRLAVALDTSGSIDGELLGRFLAEIAVSRERDDPNRFDWDDAEFLTEDFKTRLAEYGFEETEVFWSLGYCRGDGVAFYGRAHVESLKEKARQAGRLIAALEASGDDLYIEITGANGHYHHWNSMAVEIEFENETDDEDLPARLKIARPALREGFEQHLAEKVKEISRGLEKSGYAEIEYARDENAIREELLEREHLYEKDGARAMDEFDFYEWAKSDYVVVRTT